MPLNDLTRSTLGVLRGAGGYLTDLVTPSIRLGVTGLSRSGKTIFITALVRNLVEGGRLPFFGVAAEGRLVRAYLAPQPDDQLPRFAYEEHLAALACAPPRWPESTRRISQLRVTIEYTAAGRMKRTLAPGRLHLDIIDYPGEWLVDLPMMQQSFAEWSLHAMTLARAPRRAGAAAEWLAFASTLDPSAPMDEAHAMRGAELFTRYLERARDQDRTLSVAGPGRFLMPGDLAGSPLLTFFPQPTESTGPPARGSLSEHLERRYESYKAHVVRPFFRDHFSRLDRQIVLVDVLSALNAGRAGLADLEAALTTVLQPFRAGRQSWLAQFFAPRIDRIAFAATKADHLHSASHDRLEGLLGQIAQRAQVRAEAAGATIRSLALASLRATREGEVKKGGETLACIVGTPLAGEIIGGEKFDGKRTAAVFPGDLPDREALARWLDGNAGGPAAAEVEIVRFAPPRVTPPDGSGAPSPWPHVRIDRAIEFLIGDRLA